MRSRTLLYFITRARALARVKDFVCLRVDRDRFIFMEQRARALVCICNHSARVCSCVSCVSARVLTCAWLLTCVWCAHPDGVADVYPSVSPSLNGEKFKLISEISRWVAGPNPVLCKRPTMQLAPMPSTAAGWRLRFASKTLLHSSTSS